LNLQKQLLIHRPENPIDFLIKRIGKKDPLRIFIVGPPGSNAKAISQQVQQEFGYDLVNVGTVFT